LDGNGQSPQLGFSERRIDQIFSRANLRNANILFSCHVWTGELEEVSLHFKDPAKIEVEAETLPYQTYRAIA